MSFVYCCSSQDYVDFFYEESSSLGYFQGFAKIFPWKACRVVCPKFTFPNFFSQGASEDNLGAVRSRISPTVQRGSFRICPEYEANPLSGYVQ